MNVRTIVCSLICIVIIGCSKNSEFDTALINARAAHKSLMVEFGATWCSDCQNLSRELEREPLNSCVRKKLHVFRVDIGEFNRNLDIASRLGIDIKNGVIPTAVFMPPAANTRTTKLGTNEILSFLKQACPALVTQ